MSGVGADVHIEVLNFYSRQMRLLDALDIEGYAHTFTADGVTDHAHRGERIEGRDAMISAARKALPRYADAAVRHWNDNFLIESTDQGSYSVSYCSLVTRTAGDGTVTFEPTFSVQDVLVRLDGELRACSRTIYRDRPAVARVPEAS